MSKILRKIGLNILEKEFLNLDFRNQNYIFSYLLLYDNFSLKERKKQIKDFKKSIEILLKKFDEDFLLFKEDDSFKAYGNILFLDLFEKIIIILEENKYLRLIEKLIEIKLKVELGVKRYFLFEKNTIITEFNNLNQSFNYITKEQIKNNSNNFEILLYLESRKYLKEKFKFEKAHQKHFPKFIFKKNNLSEYEKFRSLFLKPNLDILEIKKENIILKDLNNLNIVILVLIILKNE